MSSVYCDKHISCHISTEVLSSRHHASNLSFPQSHYQRSLLAQFAHFGAVDWAVMGTSKMLSLMPPHRQSSLHINCIARLHFGMVPGPCQAMCPHELHLPPRLLSSTALDAQYISTRGSALHGQHTLPHLDTIMAPAHDHPNAYSPRCYAPTCWYSVILTWHHERMLITVRPDYACTAMHPKRPQAKSHA